MNRIRTVADPDWASYARCWTNDETLIAMTWGHVPEPARAAHVEDFWRWKRGLLPKIAPQLAQQIAEAIVADWDLFAPAIKFALDKLKRERGENK